MRTILLTGSDGFIGSYVAEELLNNGYKVIGIDNHSKYKKPSIDHHKHPNFVFYNYDLADKGDIYDVLEICRAQAIDYIIHTAAKIGGIEYFHKFQYDLIQANSQIDTNVIQCAIHNKIKRFIGLSSSMVYENTIKFPSAEEDVEYISPPSSSYGFSKLSMERMIKAAAEQYDLKYVIVRPFNCVGVGENDFLEGKTSHVLPDLIVKTLKSPTYLELLGDGKQIRHFTHGKDIARGIRYAMERSDDNETYNISSPVSTDMKTLARIVWNKIHPDKQLNLKVVPGYKYDIQKRVPDTTKAFHKLGFKTEISLESGVDEVIDYIKSKL